MRTARFGACKFPKAWLIAVLLLAGLQAGFAQQRAGEGSTRLSRQAEEDITALCNRQHPSLIGDYLVRQDCVVRETRIARERVRTTREREERDRRELAARPCVAEALPRIEQTIMRARNSLHSGMGLQEIQNTLDQFFVRPGSVTVSDADITMQVYVNEVRFSCITEFYFSIAVDVRRDGDSTKFTVVAHNAPAGFPEGSGGEIRLARFERNFVAERAEEPARRAHFAVLRRGAIAQRALRVINREFICPNGDCRSYIYKISITNESTETISSVTFDFYFIENANASCPVPRPPSSDGFRPFLRRWQSDHTIRGNSITVRTSLRPGETQIYQWSASDSARYLPLLVGRELNSTACADIWDIEIHP